MGGNVSMWLDLCARAEIVFCTIGRWVRLQPGDVLAIWVAGAYGMTPVVELQCALSCCGSFGGWRAISRNSEA